MTAATAAPQTSGGTMSAEVAVPVMSEKDAERLTTRITLMAGSIREGVEKLHDLVQQAKDGNAHVALGYPSWTAYLADVLGRQPIRLDPAERRELVGYLAGEGMSTRAIAPIVGVTQQAVAKSLKPHQVTTELSPAPFAVDTETGEITETPAAGGAGYESAGSAPSAPAPAVAPPVVGLDGKTYTRPAPGPRVPQPRADIPRDVTRALVQIDNGRRALEAIADRQWRAQDEEARSRWAANLSDQMDALAGVLARLNKETN